MTINFTAIKTDSGNKIRSEESGSIRNVEHLSLKFEELGRATNNFSKENMVGHGGFGNVYKVN